MPTIIDEGKLSFTFPTGWRTAQFDATNFYRHKIPTDTGAAAVDFIVSPNPNFDTLILIEVKDFRKHAAEARQRQTSGELVIEVVKKAMDTLSALYIAAYLANSELGNFVGVGLMPPTSIEIILFMEEDDFKVLSPIEQHNYKIRFADIQLKLKRTKSKLAINSRVLNTSLLKARDGFAVAHI